MVKAKGLPMLFVTLSMAETKWIHLKEILHNTDNRDINSTNCPFHVCMYFMQRFRSLKKNNSRLSGWEHICDMSNFKIVVQPIYILYYGQKLRLMK